VSLLAPCSVLCNHCGVSSRLQRKRCVPPASLVLWGRSQRVAHDQDGVDVSGWCAVQVRDVGGPAAVLARADQEWGGEFTDARGAAQDDDVLRSAGGMSSGLLDGTTALCRPRAAGRPVKSSRRALGCARRLGVRVRTSRPPTTPANRVG
jgi:hypothetical protein